MSPLSIAVQIWTSYGADLLTALPIGALLVGLSTTMLKPRIRLVGRRYGTRCHFVIAHEEEVELRTPLEIELEVDGEQAAFVGQPRLLAGPDPAVRGEGKLIGERWTLRALRVRAQTVWGLDADVSPATQSVTLTVRSGAYTWTADAQEGGHVHAASRRWPAFWGPMAFGWVIYLSAVVANSGLWPGGPGDEDVVIDFHELSGWDLLGGVAILVVAVLSYWVCVGMWRDSGAGLPLGYLGWERAGTETGRHENPSSTHVA